MNETLSMSQAKKILDEASTAIIRYEKLLQKHAEEFEEKVAQIWEDEYAVEFIKLYWSNIKGIMETTESNYFKFAMLVKEITEAYKRAGGMQQLIILDPRLPIRVSTQAPIMIGKVQNHFPMSDEFGFKNIENGPDECKDLIHINYQEQINLAHQTALEMQKINAFGNIMVKEKLEDLFVSISSITKDSYFKSSEKWMTLINQAAGNYFNASEKALGNLHFLNDEKK